MSRCGSRYRRFDIRSNLMIDSPDDWFCCSAVVVSALPHGVQSLQYLRGNTNVANLRRSHNGVRLKGQR
jgi:hypothetical protein